VKWDSFDVARSFLRFSYADQAPAFTLAAAATLALGIGASTATSTIVDTVVFRPLPYAEPDRLVKIWSGAWPCRPDRR
jgi:hypothetical protein